MLDAERLDRLLARWGEWVRHDERIGYRGSPLGRVIRRRARETLSGGSCAITPAIDDIIGDDQALAVERAVGALPNTLRTVLKMRYVEQLPNIIAAGRLRVSVSTLGRYLRHAHCLLASGLRYLGENHYM